METFTPIRLTDSGARSSSGLVVSIIPFRRNTCKLTSMNTVSDSIADTKAINNSELFWSVPWNGHRSPLQKAMKCVPRVGAHFLFRFLAWFRFLCSRHDFSLSSLEPFTCQLIWAFIDFLLTSIFNPRTNCLKRSKSFVFTSPPKKNHSSLQLGQFRRSLSGSNRSIG